MIDNCYLSLGHQLALLDHVGHLRGQPRPQRHGEGVRDAQPRRVVGPQRREVDVLADLAAAVHLDGLALQFRQLQLDGAARVGGRDFELQSEFVPDEVVGGGADALPLGAVLAGLDPEPVIVLELVGLDVGDDGAQLLLQPLLPLLVLGARVDAEHGDVVGSLLDRAHHVDYYNAKQRKNCLQCSQKRKRRREGVCDGKMMSLVVLVKISLTGGFEPPTFRLTAERSTD